MLLTRARLGGRSSSRPRRPPLYLPYISSISPLYLAQFIAPEAATMLWSNGMSVSDLESEEDGVRVRVSLNG